MATSIQLKSGYKIETRAAVQIALLALLVSSVGIVVNNFIVPWALNKPRVSGGGVQPGLLYLCTLAIGNAVYRFKALAYWKNMLITVFTTLVGSFVFCYLMELLK